MKKYLFIVLIICSTSLQAYKVGLCVVATGKYIQFVKPLIESAEKHFCTNHEVTYFIFTDGQPPELPKIVKIYQPRLGWPYDTMMRCAMYDEHKDVLQEMDYLFASDADMLFVNTVGDEILSDRVATQHPGFVGRRGSYETRPQSRAYVAPHEGVHYFAGGFHGGSTPEFLKLIHTMHENIKADLSQGIIAVWHDESHLNRYFIINPPTCILSPSYCYPERWNLPYIKRLLALDKNHAQMRG
jgi:histo-blood group ABO system transferase